MSNTSIAAPAMCLFVNTLVNAGSSTISPRDALINRAVGFILSSSAAPTRPRVRLLNTTWIVRMSARSNSWSLDTRIAPAAVAASGVMFWLQAIRFIPKALPIRATCDPMRPGQFDRWVRPVSRVNHCDPVLARSGDIDRRVSVPRRGNEPEIGKALNDVARQRGPLAHDAYDFKRQQPLNHGVRIGEVVLKYGDIRSMAED